VSTSPDETTFRHQIDTVVEGTRAVGAIIAESLASVEDVVTMPQLRVLILASSSPQNVTSVAEDLGVHPSNATRVVERLVRAGLLDRRTARHDRRRVVLTPTTEGAQLVEQVMVHRRDNVERILGRMGETQREALAEAFRVFASASALRHAP
jgi:DNA-binding MarR family transcriptional regulator